MKRGIGRGLVDLGVGLVDVIGSLVQSAIGKRKPRRVREIVGDSLGVERLREAAGRTMVADEAPSFGDERLPTPAPVPREYLGEPRREDL